MAEKRGKAAKKVRSPVSNSNTTGHSDHSEHLPRLRRVKGQVDGIERMIQEHRYCVDIVVQIRAARSALQALENVVLESHLRSCVQKAMLSKDAFEAERKIKEIIELLSK